MRHWSPNPNATPLEWPSENSEDQWQDEQSFKAQFDVIDLNAMSESESESLENVLERGPIVPPEVVAMLGVDPLRNGRFRLTGKKFALTFPQCDDEPDEVIANIRQKFGDGLKWAVVSREKHRSGDMHLHVAIVLKKKFDSRNAACFDWVAGKHGNYKTMPKPDGWLEYILKNGNDDHSTYGIDVTKYLDARKRKRSTSFLAVASMIKSGSTLKEVDAHDAGFMMQHLQKIKKYKAYCVTNVTTSLEEWTPICLDELTGCQVSGSDLCYIKVS